MPQLDKMTWLGQVAWFLVTFTALYLYLAKTGLPSMARLLKVRRRMVHAMATRPEAPTVGVTAIAETSHLDGALTELVAHGHGALGNVAGRAGHALVAVARDAGRALAPAGRAGTVATRGAHRAAQADGFHDAARRAALRVATRSGARSVAARA